MSHTPILLDGKSIAQKTFDLCAARVKQIIAKTGKTPCLATVLVGEDPASATYVKMTGKRCEEVGMKSLRVTLPAETTTEQLVKKIAELGADPAISGILLQHPVPKHIDERAAFEAIPPIKDVDGVTIHSFGAMSLASGGSGGSGSHGSGGGGGGGGDGGWPRFGPWGHVPGCCTPAGIMRLLEAYKINVSGKHAVVIGRSAILGKPMAMMLLAGDATVTICHSRTKDLPSIVRQGDIIVAAVGKAKFVQGDWIKEGAIVIDAGYNAGNVGDVDYDAAYAKSSMITPVPGGVGPMTIATLIDQTSIAAAWQWGVSL